MSISSTRLPTASSAVEPLRGYRSEKQKFLASFVIYIHNQQLNASGLYGAVWQVTTICRIISQFVVSKCDKGATKVRQKRCTKMTMRNLWYEKPRMGGMYLSTAHSGFWLKCLLMHRCIKVDDQRVKSSPTFIPKILEDILADDGLLTVRTYRNHCNLSAGKFLDLGNICLSISWQVVV